MVSSIAPLAQILLQDHPWRGNVRELRQTIKRAALVCESDMIEAANLLLLEKDPKIINKVAPDKTPDFSKDQIVKTLMDDAQL